MKVAIECSDIMLERALQLFLRDFLVRKKDCDFIICDDKIDFNKPQFIISKHSTQLKVPFSKDELLLALANFDESLQALARDLANAKIEALKAEIEALSVEFKASYQKDIERAVDDLKEKFIKIIDEKKL